MKKLVFITAFSLFCLRAPPAAEPGLLYPANLVYRGAYRLPGPSGGSDWTWSGAALTSYPDGDPNGPNDGFPGSLFGTGHDWYQMVSEITIPVPVVSPDKDVEALNTAATLQPFADIKGDLFGQLEMLKAGMEYLPPQAQQASGLPAPAGAGKPAPRGAGKLYCCWGQHFQFERVPSHIWSELDLSAPQVAGPWYIGDYDNYSTNDYLFAIPEDWAAAYLPGQLLATGRFRDGGQGGMGPCLLAISPWNEGNPPPPNATLPAVPLLKYSTSYWDDPGEFKLNDYHHSDNWSGGAWLTAGSLSAVVFVGTKGTGNCWYGCADGTVCEDPYPPECDCPERGWWSTGFVGQILFYDPLDFARVTAGQMQPYEPQPYATMGIDDVLYHVSSSQQKEHVGACAFDRARGLLYVMEPLADGEKPLVHVWEVGGGGEAVEAPVFESGDYDGDGTDDIAVFRETGGLWMVSGVTRASCGGAGDLPVPGDYNGDGTSDLGVFRGSAGLWAIGNLTRFQFGGSSDRPAPGDFDGDGTAEAGIFRDSTALWSLRGITQIRFGASGDQPVPGDYNGDGTREIGIFRPDSGLWAIPGIGRAYFGSAADIPVPGDYLAGGRWAPAIFRPASGLWAARQATRVFFGSNPDRAVPADYDGDGADDIGLFRDTSGLWAVRNVTRLHFGGSGDVPVTR